MWYQNYRSAATTKYSFSTFKSYWALNFSLKQFSQSITFSLSTQSSIHLSIYLLMYLLIFDFYILFPRISFFVSDPVPKKGFKIKIYFSIPTQKITLFPHSSNSQIKVGSRDTSSDPRKSFLPDICSAPSKYLATDITKVYLYHNSWKINKNVNYYWVKYLILFRCLTI